jgi:hypothetical protein
MQSLKFFACFAFFAAAPYAQSADTTRPAAPKVLFVYDKVDKESAFYVGAFRDELAKAGVRFEEAAVDSTKVKDLSRYEHVLIYSRVLQFNWASPVRSWAKSVASFAGKKVHIFVTANRWFAEDNKKQLFTLVSKRNGSVDAISTATNKMTDEQKIKQVADEVAKVK